MDLDKHIAYWRQSGEEDWEVACRLVEQDRVRHGLFFAHLALEKILKAHVCRTTRQVPPKIHNLARLLELAELQMTEKRRDVLADINEFCLEGRYPGETLPPPNRSVVESLMARAKDVFAWLTQQLSQA